MFKFFRILFFLILFVVSNVRLNAQCSASFSHDTASCSGSSVVFTAGSQVSGNKYNWNS